MPRELLLKNDFTSESEMKIIKALDSADKNVEDLASTLVISLEGRVSRIKILRSYTVTFSDDGFSIKYVHDAAERATVFDVKIPVFDDKGNIELVREFIASKYIKVKGDIFSTFIENKFTVGKSSSHEFKLESKGFITLFLLYNEDNTVEYYVSLNSQGSDDESRILATPEIDATEDAEGIITFSVGPKSEFYFSGEALSLTAEWGDGKLNFCLQNPSYNDETLSLAGELAGAET